MKAKDEELMLRRTPRGIPVIVDRLDYSRAATLAVYISVGSRDEPRQQCGIAHLLEHLLFKGTTQRSSKQMSQQIEAAGGEMNGYTSKELTAYYVSTLDETINTGQELLGEIIRKPLFDPKDVEVEKKVVTQEIRMAEDDPDSYIHELLAKAMWKGNPMANSEGGEVECVLPMTREDLWSFFDNFYRPPHMAIVATGNVDPNQVVDWATSTFDEMEMAKKKVLRKAPRFHPGVQLFPREGDQVYAALGFPALKASHPDRYAVSMLSAILASGTSSRLNQKVREENGLVYSIYSMAIPFTDCGVMGIFFSTSSENAEKVFRLIADELRGIKENGLEEDELTRAKRWIKGMIVRKLEPVESRMFFLGEAYLQAGALMTREQVLGRLERVKQDDVERVAQTLLDQAKLCITLHASQEEGGRIARDVKSLDF
jgi:predicted Zn-dependent peptidase